MIAPAHAIFACLLSGVAAPASAAQPESAEVGPASGTLPESELPTAPAGMLPTGADLQVTDGIAKWEAPRSEVAPALILREPLANASATSNFGTRIDPIDGRVRFHGGLDMAANHGEPVYASAGGVVGFSGNANGYGRLIVIRHGSGIETRYGHLSKALVKSGAFVRTGELIGLVGSTGRSTGPHLHWEVRVDGRATDPHGLALRGPAAPRQAVPNNPVVHWAGWGDNPDELPTPR